ncbi:hypothetical protein D3C81_2224900 [compost metagenome]
MVSESFVAHCATGAKVQDFRFDTVSYPPLGELKDNLLYTAHSVWVVGLEKMQDFQCLGPKNFAGTPT